MQVGAPHTTRGKQYVAIVVVATKRGKRVSGRVGTRAHIPIKQYMTAARHDTIALDVAMAEFLSQHAPLAVDWWCATSQLRKISSSLMEKNESTSASAVPVAGSKMRSVDSMKSTMSIVSVRLRTSSVEWANESNRNRERRDRLPTHTSLMISTSPVNVSTPAADKSALRVSPAAYAPATNVRS
jgi:hypothetical protein